jgi:hypothetical protein
MAEETPLPEAYSPPSPAWRAAFGPLPTAAEELSMSPMQRELERRIAFLESQLRENAPKDEGTAKVRTTNPQKHSSVNEAKNAVNCKRRIRCTLAVYQRQMVGQNERGLYLAHTTPRASALGCSLLTSISQATLLPPGFLVSPPPRLYLEKCASSRHRMGTCGGYSEQHFSGSTVAHDRLTPRAAGVMT